MPFCSFGLSEGEAELFVQADKSMAETKVVITKPVDMVLNCGTMTPPLINKQFTFSFPN